MKSKHFLSIADISSEEVGKLLHRALAMKKKASKPLLGGKTAILLFEKASLRTRVSFELAVKQLGGSSLYLGRDEVGLGVREPPGDVARVLNHWVDVVIARVFSHETLKGFARHSTVPVINALSDLEHPCQAMADILTIYEKKGRLKGITVAYVGDGNNVAASLALASASVGANFVIACPKGYEIPEATWEEASRRASDSGSVLKRVAAPKDAVGGADVVYTDVWVSMGQEGETAKRKKDFVDYQVNENLMEFAASGAIFMHDMPAHRGEEISQGMLDHPQSVVFDQADNRLHAQKAILAEIVEGAE